MIKIKEIAYTGYPVTDIARAQKFYEGVLGLKPSCRFGEGDQAWIEYDIGAGTLAISNMGGDKWLPHPQGPSVALEVESFAEALAEIRASGAKVYLEPMESPVCSFAVVADPDGNSVMIHQRKG
ncbi:MAG: VOC family protein [Opitutaceae bacterium]|nr:VOC family protein [Opitutaceae bacterium]